MELSLSDEPTTDITSRIQHNPLIPRILNPVDEWVTFPPTHCNGFILIFASQPPPHFRGELLRKKVMHCISVVGRAELDTPHNAIDTTTTLVRMAPGM